MKRLKQSPPQFDTLTFGKVHALFSDSFCRFHRSRKTFRQSPNIALGILLFGLLSISNCPWVSAKPYHPDEGDENSVQLVVLGVAQDAGYPQSGCEKKCCEAAWRDASLRRNVSCVAVVDRSTGSCFVFDCTPDFPAQWRHLTEFCNSPNLKKSANHDAPDSLQAKPTLDGIFLTHAHIGHYTGLMHLGREAMGAKNVPVFGMPRMLTFLQTNGPWSQLESLENIQLNSLTSGKAVQVSKRIKVTPILVPHRDEFSETVGFQIAGPNKTVLYLPDIDKWSRWDRKIENFISNVDVAYLDGTFLSNGELPGRDMSLIPHPFIEESIKRFSALDGKQREKVRFIHLNHTNPALIEGSAAETQIQRSGMHVARQGETIDL